MKYIILTSILFFALSTVKGQKFKRAAGIRLGHSSGIFFDVNHKDLSTLRFMVTFREGGDQLTVMKYFHNYKVSNLPGYLSIYYGYGVHAGYVKWDQYLRNSEHGYYWEEMTAPVAGLDALVGISYDFKRLPLSVTCDLKPYFDFWGRRIVSVVPFDFALGVSYSF